MSDPLLPKTLAFGLATMMTLVMLVAIHSLAELEDSPAQSALAASAPTLSSTAASLAPRS